MSQKPNLPRWRIDHWRAEKGTLMVLAVALGL
jgi:hypothetical protein